MIQWGMSWSILDDYHTPVKDLEGDLLQFSTLEKTSRNRSEWTLTGAGSKQCCLFCGRFYRYRPAIAAQHLDSAVKPREVAACSPTVQHMERHKQIVAELRERADEKRAARKRKAEEDAAREGRDGSCAAGSAGLGSVIGSADAPINLDVNHIGGSCTQEEMNKQWGLFSSFAAG